MASEWLVKRILDSTTPLWQPNLIVDWFKSTRPANHSTIVENPFSCFACFLKVLDFQSLDWRKALNSLFRRLVTKEKDFLNSIKKKESASTHQEASIKVKFDLFGFNLSDDRKFFLRFINIIKMSLSCLKFLDLLIRVDIRKLIQSTSSNFPSFLSWQSLSRD